MIRIGFQLFHAKILKKYAFVKIRLAFLGF